MVIAAPPPGLGKARPPVKRQRGGIVGGDFQKGGLGTAGPRRAQEPVEQRPAFALSARFWRDGDGQQLGFVGDDNVEGGLPGGPCPLLSVSFGAPELQRFVQSLPLGSLASVCADNYAPFFEQAVSSIRTACDEFSAPLR